MSYEPSHIRTSFGKTVMPPPVPPPAVPFAARNPTALALEWAALVRRERRTQEADISLSVKVKAATENRQRIAAMLAEGKTTREISDVTDLHTSTVNSHITEIREGKLEASKGGRKPHAQEHDARIAALHSDGLTNAEISAETGLHTSTIYMRTAILGLIPNKKRRAVREMR